ncbi:MAG: F0F1 ATP synthase subunit A [bacterium]|nr:F0F1 ATP synthase subunit A [bacterium]
MADIHVSITAEKIFDLGFMEVTNSMFTAWVVTIIASLVLLSIVTTLKKSPGVLQNIYESVYSFLYKTVDDILGKKLTNEVFPLMLTLFIFILFGSWFGLLPISGTLGFFEEHDGEKVGVPVFRAPTADINMAIALALVVFFVIEYYGFKHHGLGYLKRFFNFSNPVNFFVGILDLVSDLMRILTFSFRLFGNIFAGEVIIAVIVGLAGFLVLPFLAFEVFVGVIQALVFVMLTTVFISLAVEHSDH